MTEDTTPERIPFEKHPLYPLYKAGRPQWNLFMKEYLYEDEIIEISKRNPKMKDDFESESTLTVEQEYMFDQYMKRKLTKQKGEIRHIFYILDFENYIFNEHIKFADHLFPNNASFVNTKSLGEADFQSTQFLSWVNFWSAQFLNEAYFAKTQFSKMAYFQSAQFLNEGSFKSAEFSDNANFRNANFEGEIDFSNTKFKVKTDFTRATFKHYVPQFYEATLHQDTVFEHTIWPDNSNIDNEGVLLANRSAYNRLVLEMNKQLRHEQELKFFAKELEAQRHIHWHKKQLTSWLLNYFYYITSYYGRSIRQPVILGSGLIKLAP